LQKNARATFGGAHKDSKLFTLPRNNALRGTVPAVHTASPPPQEAPNYMPSNHSFGFDGFRWGEKTYAFSPDSILRLNQILDIAGLSRSSIYNYVKAGTFPRPRKLGSRAVGWLASEVFEWIATRGHNL
jgi:prophage regulatory protein